MYLVLSEDLRSSGWLNGWAWDSSESFTHMSGTWSGTTQSLGSTETVCKKAYPWPLYVAWASLHMVVMGISRVLPGSTKLQEYKYQRTGPKLRGLWSPALGVTEHHFCPSLLNSQAQKEGTLPPSQLKGYQWIHHHVSQPLKAHCSFSLSSFFTSD